MWAPVGAVWGGITFVADFAPALLLIGLGSMVSAAIVWNQRRERERIPIRIDPERITTPTQVISRGNIKAISVTWEQPEASRQTLALARISCLTPFGERSFETHCSPATALGLQRLLTTWLKGVNRETWGTPAWWNDLNPDDWSPRRTAELQPLKPKPVADGMQVQLRRRTRRGLFGITAIAGTVALWIGLLWYGPLTTVPGLSVLGLSIGPLELVALLLALIPAGIGAFLLVPPPPNQLVVITPVGLRLGDERFAFQNMDAIALQSGALHIQNTTSKVVLEHPDLAALYALSEMLEATRAARHSKADPIAMRSLRALTQKQ